VRAASRKRRTNPAQSAIIPSAFDLPERTNRHLIVKDWFGSTNRRRKSRPK
jgi:hypothetical protein